MKEREEYGIKKNEFVGENNEKLKLDRYIIQEYKDINKHYRDKDKDINKYIYFFRISMNLNKFID